MSTQDAAIGTEAGDRLISVFASQGLTLEPVTASTQVSGPLTAVTFKPAGDPAAQPALALTVMSDGQLESLDQSVAAVLAVYPELEQGATTAVASDTEIVASLPEPHELFAIIKGAEPIGLLVRHNDRRSGGAGPAAAGTPFPAAANPGVGVPQSLGLLQEIVLEVSVELGRSSMPLAQLMNLSIGSIVELDRAAGSPVDVRVNGMLFARGEVVALDDEYAVRIIEILGSPRQ